MMMSTRFFTFFLSLIFGTTAFAQLTPPGLGETETAFWSAIGVSQKLDEKNTSKTYFGTGYISGTENGNPFNEPSIMVLNQEFYHKLNSKWQYSYALSYRRQHEYDDSFDEPQDIGIKQEFRVYGRISYTVPVGNLKWTTTLRQEVRKFYTNDFAQVPEDLQLRTRLKTQLFVPLDNDSENSIIGSAEVLFAMTNDSNKGWNNPEYKEARFCLYYSYSPNEIPVTFDIGYMNDLMGNGYDTSDAGYLAMDIIIKDPFSHS
ncbi:DUF2490 domain-containing protein [Flavobacterium hauense]